METTTELVDIDLDTETVEGGCLFGNDYCVLTFLNSLDPSIEPNYWAGTGA